MAFVARLARLTYPALPELAQKSRDLLPPRDGLAPSLQQWAFSNSKCTIFDGIWGLQGSSFCIKASVNENACDNHGSENHRENQQPPPVLGRMSEDPNDVSSVKVGNDGNGGITDSPREPNHNDKLSHAVVIRSTCGREENAGW
jgi:hypothetical protein